MAGENNIFQTEIIIRVNILKDFPMEGDIIVGKMELHTKENSLMGIGMVKGP